jgi:vacuolar-type H+-ATPase subunit F/Vma7
MGRLIVITTPDLAPGFELAGVDTFAVDSRERAQSLLREFLEKAQPDLIAVCSDLIEDMDLQLQRRVDRSYHPVVIAIPGGTPSITESGRQRYIAELIRRAVGFQITFETKRTSPPLP